MPTFDPTLAPPSRLARLGVLLDRAESSERLRGLGILCDRAGIDAVWLGDRDGVDDPSRWAGSWGAAAEVASSLMRARLGVLVDGDTVPPAANEVAVPARRAAGLEAGPHQRRSAHLADLDELPGLFELVDDIVLPGWTFPDLETAADEVRAECREAGRDPATLGVAALVTVSIGRTEAEASARARDDEAFRRLGHPREVGIFGALEECQDRVIALAHAGITDLRCVLPANDDIHDVIAQLTAITIGTTDVLIPGSLRSPAPPAPVGWGGRPDVPPAPRVSGGSKRR
jgi:alkanesulfonate monooxygenase SsuD/methylene tetrahydromethanopterin reductase-like flavin-dependent oxidoreductase (luciferase family)